MKKSLIITLSIIGVVLILLFAVIGSYNGLVKAEQKVESANSQISVQLQRRADLIPNFVSTIKGSSNYEQSTHLAVTEARSKVMSANTAGEQAAASAQLDSAIDIWVNAVTENYPQLTATKQYQALLDELAGTENRIAVARKDYNDTARNYNTKIKQFPRNLFAGMFGFESYEYFEADASSQSVPQVSFD